jgi:16S rRNA (cytosine967-C5)-methyltransferase
VPSLRLALRAHPEREARAFVTDVCYGALRWRITLEGALAARLEAPERLPNRVRDVLLAGAYERLVRGTPDHAAVHAWVEAVNRGPPRERPLAGLVNAVLRRVDLADVQGDAALSLPPFLASRFRVLLGADDAARAAHGMRQPAPLWLTASDPERAAASLAAQGARARPGPVPGSLAVQAPLPLERLAAFEHGLVQPQNPASLAVVAACAAGPGERTLDLCGGNGVKAAALAARGAEVTSVEIDPEKVEAAKRNLRRLGVAVTHRVADLRTLPAGIDPAASVLLDAPCSGTGTLRAHPEITLRLSEAALAELTRLQAALLDTAAGLTAPGGLLVYAVCSLTPEEGPEQVEAFVNRHPEFEPVKPNLPLPARDVGPGAVIVPLEGLDGFFVAALRRAADT